MELMRPGLNLTALLTLVCWMAGAGAVSAQSRSAAPGMFRCADCPSSGQTAGPSSSSGDQTTFIPRVEPVFDDAGGFQIAIIGRVLMASPLVLEALDDQAQVVDRDLKSLRNVTDPAGDNGSCSIARFDILDLSSKRVVSTLRFNDLVTATLEGHRNEQNPTSVLAATTVLTRVRRVTKPVAYFHPNPGPGCSNRSGRLVEYHGPGNDLVTVYNDGAISYRDALFRTFRGRLSAGEQSDLLNAFSAANFNDLPAIVPRNDWAKVPAITLLAARYQHVMTEHETSLTPLIQRMRELRLRVLSHTYFLLKTGAPRKIAILPWPYPNVKLREFPTVKLGALNQSQDAPGSGPGDLRALEAPVPDEFFDRLPVAEVPGTGPGPLVYFKEGERIYRVTKNPQCAAVEADCKTFSRLHVLEIQELDAAVRVQARSIHRTIRYSGPSYAVAEGGGVDPALLPEFGIHLLPWDYLWSADMGLRLASVFPGGVTISLDEYERHKTAYFPILSAGRSREGMRLIEGDLLFEHVRLCHIEPGIVDDCEVR